jgi:hypothetical protein
VVNITSKKARNNYKSITDIFPKKSFTKGTKQKQQQNVKTTIYLR